MTGDQTSVFIVLAGVMGLFIWGRWRYDLVAFAGLLTAVLLGLIPAKDAFLGFSSSAVITVAAVLIVSRGLAVSGAIDRIAHILVPKAKNLMVQVAGISGFAAALSAMMNNVGALALLMPATMESAKKAGRSPALLLMPLSFGSILGGLITLIGTPPNIVIASYRAEVTGEAFSMFDFTPVGASVAIVGVIFLALFGWRLLPQERKSRSADHELFEIDAYVAEVIILEDSGAVGHKILELDKIAQKHDVRIAGLVRNHRRILRPGRRTAVEAGDILILQSDAEDLDKFNHALGLEIKGDFEKSKKLFSSDNVTLVEAVVSPDSRFAGRVIGDLRLRSRFGINLLGISRQGHPIRRRIHKVVVRAGDVLLFQAANDGLANIMARLGVLPLAGRDINIGRRDHALLAIGFLVAAIGLASFGIIELTIALSLAALFMVLSNIVPVRDMYDSIDWPVIVLVGCMIPLGGTLETTGGTALIAEMILDAGSGLPGAVVLTLIFVITMTLSDVMNNVATAVLMAPVALTIATGIGANPDAFLMAVAVGASCAFLTPIGHKNNALIMGPGGYKFGDYWRMGLPLEVIITVVGVPAILYFWPL
jgi:di/tricarboxylate transporter